MHTQSAFNSSPAYQNLAKASLDVIPIWLTSMPNLCFFPEYHYRSMYFGQLPPTLTLDMNIQIYVDKPDGLKKYSSLL